MRYYELTYLISPELSEEKINALRERIIACLKEKGEVLSEPGSLIKKILGYPIRKKKNAFLATLNFSAPAEIIDSLKKVLDGETEILRYFITNNKGAAKAITPPLPEKYKSFTSLPSTA